MSDETIDLKLHVWRQSGPSDGGGFQDYSKHAKGISTHASFLEMLDVINERLVAEGERPIAFDHDCREGICGMCGLVINGVPHGHRNLTTTCQLHMREFQNGQEVYIEPFRAGAFPVIRDLMVDRTAFDTIIQAGGYVSVRTGSAPDANEIPIPKQISDRAFDAATCIGCGACVAACPNASGSLFLSAKLAHLNLLPQGQAERYRRTRSMVKAHDDAGFGGCTNHKECEAACPKGISTDFIARMNRDVLVASLTDKDGDLV
ncbi:MAG: succinate dehydrogenase/fumarate reductase iron-sulfur subunit [Sandaracinaceae bacterium]